jgi:hypothetical protein
MSIQIQVLITALMVTLKTHVFSVLILLFLLIYIASIIAYFFFGNHPGLEGTWGNIFTGMLRLFSFVTVRRLENRFNEKEFKEFLYRWTVGQIRVKNLIKLG